jgi:hypothetical protein
MPFPAALAIATERPSFGQLPSSMEIHATLRQRILAQRHPF